MRILQCPTCHALGLRIFQTAVHSLDDPPLPSCRNGLLILWFLKCGLRTSEAFRAFRSASLFHIHSCVRLDFHHILQCNILQQLKCWSRHKNATTGMQLFIELHFIALYRCCIFYKVKARPSTSKTITTHFIAKLALLMSGTEPAISPRYACIFFSPRSHPFSYESAYNLKIGPGSWSESVLLSPDQC